MGRCQMAYSDETMEGEWADAAQQWLKDLKNLGECRIQSDEKRLDPRRYSVWGELVRVQAYVQRLINNCQVFKEERQMGEFTVNELKEEEIRTTKVAQQDAFKKGI
ncbi:hypothetical protein HOLleu_31272 [Holothuria leucospilota]|uniref:Uncharacterized protein n=1 Tax=Holothuria leucospilota TaxID=206669 RepID=A0A9Q0YQ07_HOLLE|nr:hypothetical protein HOLleu_31272 [Holothuria leucospilota]